MRRAGHPDGGRRSPLAGRARRVHAVRVASVATLIIAVVYLGAMTIFNMIAGHQLVAQVDYQLSSTVHEVGLGFSAAVLPDDADKDVGSPPILLWRVDGSSGRTLRSSRGAPRLPASAWPRSDRPATVRLDNANFRITALRTGDVWLVAAQSLEDVEHIQRQVLFAEAVAAPVLLIAIFLGTLMVGLKASGPVEHARRRQLEFTADASHELRTPLSVIEAETGLALSSPRDAGQYRTTLQRVSGESKRLRRIVDDLLWLARFDSEPANPGHEPVDVLTIAEICADRFSAVAGSRGISLTACSEGEPQALITAPPEWIDRLTGVLVDNACRYAGAGGDRSPAVRIAVGCQGSKVSLTVEDSGPGIPEEERARLFHRFYRANDGTAGSGQDGGGSGLGLAIADAVVRSTGGKWRVDDSPLGGARMQVTWHRSGDRRNLRALARGGTA